ncbi:MAG: hypothetical protein HY048_08915 [Acidobacteria bacterium]|nr:hypothetical protein [Acidobacteriota bacterium]
MPRLIPSLIALALSTMMLAAPAASAAMQVDDTPLARARQLYNQRQFDAALQAADQARRTPALADAADLVAARAYLERFRLGAAPEDLDAARTRLGRLDPRRFPARERTEFIIGLGEALHFDEAFGAAASVFETVLLGGDPLPAPLDDDARGRVVDWWATALDRDARPRPDADRRAVYQRIRARMIEELATHPASGAAAYWLVAAARAEGDLQGAWAAAEAGWARASLAGDGGAMLRADLDQLMQRAIVPERARALAQPPQTLQLQWDQFKERWAR